MKFKCLGCKKIFPCDRGILKFFRGGKYLGTNWILVCKKCIDVVD